MRYIVLTTIIGLIFNSCEKPPTYANKPIITSISITPTVVRSYINDSTDAQNLPDSVNVTIGFTDGNGLLGSPNSDTNAINAYLVDNRSTPSGTKAVNAFSIPFITPSGNVKAISGTISFNVTDIIGRPDPAHTVWDTLTYTVYIVDRNGIMSNTMITPNLYIKDN